MEIFIFFDGDGIGDRIELLLLDGNLVEAGFLSERINSAMLKLRDSLESIPGVRVDLFGGDDLVAATTEGALALSKLDQLREAFHTHCGCTISAGIGKSIQEALANLRRAKLSGKNQLIFPR